jgi:hypothetical protein
MFEATALIVHDKHHSLYMTERQSAFAKSRVASAQIIDRHMP